MTVRHVPSPFRSRLRRTAGLVALPALLPALAGAQQRPPADTAARDSVARLPDVRVSVTSREQSLERVPWAVGVAGERVLRRAQPTVGFEEGLTTIPGVYVAARYNYAVDSRVSIRGFGNRANFGLRGVRVLLDGIPQTLPDGQSQITNIELGTLDRVEVLRGSASALYGNGTGGVLSFQSDLGGPAPIGGIVRVTGGSFGLRKWQARVNGRTSRAVGMLSVSRLTTDGFRQHSSAEVRQVNAAADIAVSPLVTAQLRLNHGEVPAAFNPGALTTAEYAVNRDSASRFNVIRGADKRTRQSGLGATLRRVDPDGNELVATVYGATRDVRNALAVAPPAPASPVNGTFATLDRSSGGARIAGARQLGSAPTAPRLTLGIEWQRMQDLRENRRATAGRPTAPTDTLLLSQVEAVTSLGPFVQLGWQPTERVELSLGGRYDRTRFSVDDRFDDNGDQSGGRTMPAWSGHLGASATVAPLFVPYANLSTAFETPTTTELQVRPDGLGGFNPSLDPQRTVGAELGARGESADGRWSYSVAGFRNQVTGLVVQFLETNGRAFFQNAGGARNSGAEVELSARPLSGVQLVGAYTYARYRYGEYRQVRGAVTDTLDGNTLPGVPEHFARLGLRLDVGRGVTLDADHMLSSSVVADDRNTVRVDGWGAGVTNVRVAWTGRIAGTLVTPFGGVQNLGNRSYVSAVTVNGFGGRVIEPAPLRNVYLGFELGVGR